MDRTQTLLWKIELFSETKTSNETTKIHATKTYLNETRVTNYDDIISGYFFKKIFNITSRDEEPKSRLEIHLREIIRVLNRTFNLFEEHIMVGLNRTGLLPGEFAVCSCVCGRNEICLEMRRME